MKATRASDNSNKMVEEYERVELIKTEMAQYEMLKKKYGMNDA